MYLIIAILSILLSCWITRFFRSEPLIFNSIFLVYLLWHLPLVLSIVLPFTFPLREEDNFIYLLLILLLIHFIVAGGAFALFLTKSKNSNRILSSKLINNPYEDMPPPYVYIVGAFMSPFILGIDNFFIKGVSISLNLSENREIVGSSSTFLSLISVVCAGFAIYLLNWIWIIKYNKVKFRPLFLIPFVMTAIVIILTGNRQFLFLGIMLILLKAISIYRPSIRQLMYWLVYIVCLGVPLAIVFQFLRQSNLEGRQDSFIMSILSLTVVNGHPFEKLLGYESILFVPALYIYVYFGTQYDTISAYMKGIGEYMPFGSLTLPVLYRRWSDFFGLPVQDSIRDIVHGQIQSKFGIFPRIWATMFGGICAEGGIGYIIAFSLFLSYIHFKLVNNFLKNEQLSTTNLIIFYLFIMFGIITIGTYEVPFFFMIIQALVLTIIRSKIRNLKHSIN
jgi:hypothetical protein